MSTALERALEGFEPLAGVGRRLPYVLLDVFTDTPLRGNPLAVFTAAGELEGGEMQRIAREMNLSESVFCLPPRSGGDLRVRIFTPAEELPFAGHPTIGTAILAGAALGRGELLLEMPAGEVPVRVGPLQGRGGSAWMLRPVSEGVPFARVTELLAAVGVAETALEVREYVSGPRHVMVALGEEREVGALQPDLRALSELGPLCVSCFAGSERNWRTRMFAPALGVAEDPATGSAAGPLAAHLAAGGLIGPAEEIEIRQGEEVGRPSLLRVRLLGDEGATARLEVGGSAVIVGRGELLI